MSGELCYLYGVLPAAVDLPADSLGVGVAGAPVRLLSLPSLQVALSGVPARDFAEDVLPQRLEDPAWVSSLAMAHYDVIDRLFGLGAVLPMRLATLFSVPERVVGTVTAAEQRLLAGLDQIDGCAQWTVRVDVRPRRQDDAREATSGADYLRRVGTRDQRRAETTARVVEHAAQLHRRLTGLVRGHQAAEGEGLPSVAHYLVPVAATPALMTALQETEAADPDAAIDVRGPLPPYSFAPRLDQAA